MIDMDRLVPLLEDSTALKRKHSNNLRIRPAFVPGEAHGLAGGTVCPGSSHVTRMLSLDPKSLFLHVPPISPKGVYIPCAQVAEYHVRK